MTTYRDLAIGWYKQEYRVHPQLVGDVSVQNKTPWLGQAEFHHREFQIYCGLVRFALVMSIGVHQEKMKVIFGHLWGLWKALKTSKTLTPHIFQEIIDRYIFYRHGHL